MAFFDEMKDKISLAGQTTVQRAKDLSEITRLNMAITESEKQITAYYTQIGRTVSEMYDHYPVPSVEDQIRKIKEINQQIEENRERIRQLSASASDTCPSCGARIKPGIGFCGNCGQKLTAQENIQTGLFCAQCGKSLPEGTVFCPYCGTKVQ